MDPRLTERLGYTAAGLVLATFSVRSMIALRTLAFASNPIFIVNDFFHVLRPIPTRQPNVHSGPR
jgi:hypothetical protein